MQRAIIWFIIYNRMYIKEEFHASTFLSFTQSRKIRWSLSRITKKLNTLKSNDNFIIESLRIFLEDPRETSKTLFFILKNEDVEKARTVIDKTLGGIDKPNTGIMFGIDLTFVAGLNIE